VSGRGVIELAAYIARSEAAREQAHPAAVVSIGRRQERRAQTAPAWTDDVLRRIDPPTFVEALTGLHVPPSGMVSCPLPGHDDRTPSFKAYPDAERGVWCHGCQRGGSIYDFAAQLWGYPLPLRGPDFLEVKRRLLDELLAVSGGAA